MADELEPPDPLQSLMERHVSRMEEISAAGVKHMQQVSSDLVSKLKRNVGLRSEVTDRALTALGITDKPPVAEAATDAPE